MREYIEIKLTDTAIQFMQWHKNGSRHVREYPLNTQFSFNGREYIPFNPLKQVQEPITEWADD